MVRECPRWLVTVVMFMGLTIAFTGMLLALRACGETEPERRWPRPIGSTCEPLEVSPDQRQPRASLADAPPFVSTACTSRPRTTMIEQLEWLTTFAAVVPITRSTRP